MKNTIHSKIKLKLIFPWPKLFLFLSNVFLSLCWQQEIFLLKLCYHDDIRVYVINNYLTYSVSINFRLELIEPSARDVEGQQVFFSSDTVSSLARLEPYSLLLPHSPPPLFSLKQSPKIHYLSIRRLYKLQAKISGHAEIRIITYCRCPGQNPQALQH